MPLTKRQFELGVDQEIEEYMRQIYHRLVADRDVAYNHAELLRAVVSRPPSDLLLVKFNQAIEVLVRIGAAEARVVAGETYYAFQREVNENTWKASGGNVARYPSFS